MQKNAKAIDSRTRDKLMKWSLKEKGPQQQYIGIFAAVTRAQHKN
jgi:hypothetical protein